MKAIHAFSIALLLGAAAALGAVAATRTATATTGSTAAASSVPASPAASIHSRQVKLARWQHQLHRALGQRFPKLPKLVRFPPLPVAVAVQSAAPVYVSQITSAPAQRTAYVHAKAPPPSGYARGYEGEGAHSQGASHDD